MNEELTFRSLIEDFGFFEEKEHASKQIGNNTVLVFDEDLSMSIRLGWKDGDGADCWGQISNKHDLKELVELLSNEKYKP
jgi:hypothetical protein